MPFGERRRRALDEAATPPPRGSVTTPCLTGPRGDHEEVTRVVEQEPELVDPSPRATNTVGATNTEGATSTAAPSEPGLLVQTTVEVLDGGPILEVAHTTHGCWHLTGHAHPTHHGDRPVTTRPGSTIPAAASWALLVVRDPSLSQVAGLPPGWTARRDSPSSSWRRSPS